GHQSRAREETPMTVAVVCRGCGFQLQVEVGPGRARTTCPLCGAVCEPPAPVKKQTAATHPPTERRTRSRPKRQDAASTAHHDDGKPYPLTGGEQPRCPNCRKVLAPNAVLCVACGFNLATGEKAVQVYEPLVRRWEAGLPFGRRMAIFLTAQCVVLPLGL